MNVIEDSYPLSPMQQGMLFHSLDEQQSGVYIEQIICSLYENLNVSALMQSWRRVVERHSVLRTSFYWEGANQLMQSAYAQVKLPLEQQDWRGLSDLEQESRLQVYLQNSRQRGFDLKVAPLMCLALFRLAEADYKLVWTFHHALLDGRSFLIVLKEVFAFYEGFCQNRDCQLEKPRHYRDYIDWLQQATPSKAEEFWRQLLRGFTAPTQMSVAKDSELQTTSYGMQEVRLSVVSTSALQSLAQSHQLTLNTLIQGAWALLLSRYSGEDDVVFGATRACRHSGLNGMESMVGLFINTLPVRVQVAPDSSLLPWLMELRAQWISLRAYEHTSLVKVQEWSEVPRGMPLFESIVMFENYELNAALRSQGGNWNTRGFQLLEQIDYPLVLMAYAGSELLMKLSYDCRRFDRCAIQRMLEHLRTLLEGITANSRQHLKDLPLLTAVERHQLLVEWNPTRDYPQDTCIHHLFEAQVERAPDRVAVVFENQQLTYGELNCRANKLAHYLQSLGVGPEVMVGLCADRSLEMVVGIFGILKAGGAYVPLDPAYPQERLAFMLEDSQVPVVVTQQQWVESLPESSARVICLDTNWQAIERGSVQNPVNPVLAKNLAYVIYTSGSTGKPKGVLVNHRNIVRLFAATQAWFYFNENDVWTLFHSYAFDFSVWELWGALIYGGRLVVVPYWVSRSPEAFYKLLEKEQVTVLNQTPSAFRQLIQGEVSSGRAQQDLALRLVIFGGEALELQSLKSWFERHGDQSPQLVNMYGITETTVHVTYQPLTAADLTTASGSVIGIPIPDLQLYILDQYRQPVPIGVPGEMYIGGAGVTRGYLNRPELTEERFIPNPFSDEPGARLYRSGDLARYLPNREIEYLGRIDHQVKIRGFRIELGEIEAALGRHPAVREAVVLAWENGLREKRLVAYLVPREGVVPSIMELRQFLETSLPEYMVPSAFVILDQFPLTANGKLDRQALPAPEQSRPDLNRRYVAPRTPTEIALAQIWAEMLRLEQVGIHDNFFELGGDSILSIQLTAKAKREGIQLSPNQLFLHPTIAELTKIATVAPTLQSEPDLVQGTAPLTPIQNWFFEQDFPTYHHWNQAFLFEVKQVLDIALLESAVQQLTRHHDALRLRFVLTDSGYQQFFADPAGAALVTHVALTDLPLSDQVSTITAVADEAQASLNLSTGPLLRVIYFNLGPDQPGRLLIVIHHLVVDGVSWHILMEDLESVYQALQVNITPQLPPKTTSYQQWVVSLTDYAQSSKLLEELDYWIKVSEGAGIASIPVDCNPVGPNSEVSVRAISVSLDRATTQALLKEVPIAYNTQINDVLLTALVKTITTWVGCSSILIDLEGHGREDVIEGLDLSRTVGWFTTVFPICLNVNAHTSPGSALKAVKEQLRRIPNRGIGYGMLRYLTDNPTITQQLQSTPQPQVVFNYLGQVERVVADSNLFAFAHESTGRVHSPAVNRRHLIEIIGQVLDGQLRVTWLYSENIHWAETIERLAKDFINALSTLITHCLSVDYPSYTPSDFPLAKLDQASLERLLVSDRSIEDIYPLSPMQQLFYSIDAINPTIGFEQWHFTLHGNLNVVAFQWAWEQVVNRYAVLRTVFKSDGLSEPHQIVYKQVSLPWTQYDWRGLPETQQQQRLASFLQADQERGFDLSQAPLTRIALIQVADAAYHFIWSTHHLEIDGWSWPLVFKDLSQFYEAFQQGQAVDIGNSPPYRNYISWLRQQDFGQAEVFWRQYLKGFTTPIPLAGSKQPARSPNQDTHSEIDVRLSAEVLAALQSLARQNQVTLSTLFQGAWALLLSASSGLEEVVFGATFSGRSVDLDGVEAMVGPFVNNLPVRVQVSSDAFLISWLRQLQEQQFELSRYQHAPLTKIQEWSEVPLRDRLFESLIVFQNYVVDESALRLGNQVTICSIASPQSTNYPLTIIAVPSQDLQIKIIYHCDLFDNSMVTTIIQDLQRILESIAKAQTPQLSDFLVAKVAWKGTHQNRQALVESVGFCPGVKPTYMAPQTEMEQTIAKVWQKAFDIDKIGLYDNFFDLGGYSVMLVAVHGELQAILNTTFPITKMFQHPTINSLANYLSQGQDNKPSYEKVYNRAQRQREALMRMKKPKRGLSENV